MDSIVEGFFYGKIDENTSYPCLSEEQRETGKTILQAVDKFCQDHIDSSRFDEEGTIPKEVIQGLAQLGLCGMGVSEEYGGIDLSISLYCRVFGTLAAYDGSVATTLGAHQSIGYRALLNDGTEEQKKKWLPKLASGEHMAAFCLTEPAAGSDAYSISTKATCRPDGNYVIEGQKTWITNGGLAHIYTVFCKTQHEIDGKMKDKITCFIVEKDREGISFGEAENKMGIRASETRSVFFDKVEVPPENIIGELGKGFKIAMNVLNSGRLSLGAGTVGAMKSIMDLATKQAGMRKQFGKPIIEFHMIQKKLATMAAVCYATESAVYMTTGNMERGLEDYYLESAICKVYGSEALWYGTDAALQIAGGAGFMKEYPYERLMRDARIYPIFEGTNEVLRCFIALSGMRGPSEYLKEVGKISDVASSLKDPVKSLGVLGKFAGERFSKMIGSSHCKNIDPFFSSYSSSFSSMVGAFAIQVEDTLIKYGKDIVDNELPLLRISNMAIELYVMLATLLRTSQIMKSKHNSKEKKRYACELTHIVWKNSRSKFMGNLKEMSSNDDKAVCRAVDFMNKSKGHSIDILND